MVKVNVKTGDKYGRFTIIQELPIKILYGRKLREFKCLCICGVTKNVLLQEIRYGSTKSCGCLIKDLNQQRREIAQVNTRTYSSWSHMRQRCGAKVDLRVKKYYANISICGEWSKFKNFLNDMGVRPEGTSLDRINNHGNYCKENCRWATQTEQVRNRNNSVYYQVGAKRLHINVAATVLGVKVKTLYSRYYRMKK